MTISAVISTLLLSGLLTMIASLVAARWHTVSAIFADGTAMQRDPDQLVLPLRFAA